MALKSHEGVHRCRKLTPLQKKIYTYIFATVNELSIFDFQVVFWRMCISLKISSYVDVLSFLWPIRKKSS